MARNEEKQQGRLNRLWLQKEREEGRLKDVHEKRPRLSSLNSASSVKKWIPSIKKDIEYYLQQSQLSHYPERKIAEFQLQIEALEKEYKSFISKLRVLDPSCKHKPWTPRAYCKRRADPQDSPINVKQPRCTESQDGGSQQSGSDTDFTRSLFRSLKSSLTEGHPTFSETQCRTSLSSESVSETGVCAIQDQPLSFDQTRLAIAAAAFRGPSLPVSSSQTQKLAQLLQSGLPNLSYFQSRQTLLGRDTEKNEAPVQPPTTGHKRSNGEEAERKPGELSINGITEEQTSHVLGLDYYSSSDEDCDTF